MLSYAASAVHVNVLAWYSLHQVGYEFVSADGTVMGDTEPHTMTATPLLTASAQPGYEFVSADGTLTGGGEGNQGTAHQSRYEFVDAATGGVTMDTEPTGSVARASAGSSNFIPISPYEFVDGSGNVSMDVPDGEETTVLAVDGKEITVPTAAGSYEFVDAMTGTVSMDV